MDLAEWITVIVSRFGYVGVGALVALENLVPPIPSEVVLPMAGFAAARGVVTLPGAIVAATAGSVVGALTLYGIGRGIGERRVRRLVARHGRWVLLGPQDIDRADEWFARYGSFAVLGGRLVPGVRSFVSLPAGASRMGLGRFTVLTTIGSGVWNIALISVGFVLGAQWHLVADWIGRVSTLVWIIVGLLVLWFVARRVLRRLRPQAGTRQ